MSIMNGENCAVILAGGKGSRLKPYTAVLPKPLVPVDETPIMEIVIRQLKSFGFDELIVATNHGDRLIRSYFHDVSRFGVHLTYSLEDRPLGTIGPLHLVEEQLPDTFLVMNGDLLTDVDYRALFSDHKASGCDLTLGTFERKVQIADGVLEVGPDDRITGFREKPVMPLRISMGVYALNKSVLRMVPKGRSFGMDDLVGAMLSANAPIHAYNHTGMWCDIGTVPDLADASRIYAEHQDRFIKEADPLVLVG